MVILSLLQWVNIVIVLFAMIPTTVLLYQYSYIKITDYLLFAAFFISSGITLIATILVQKTESLIFIQIHNIFYVTSFYLLFLHALRLKWQKSPRWFKRFGYFWYYLLIILTIFWKKLPQPRPERTTVLILNMKPNYSSFSPLEAGLKIGDIMIYSSRNAILGILFFQFVLLFLIYNYLTLDPVMKSKRVSRSKRCFTFAWINFLIWSILISPWFADVFRLPNALLIITIVVISYIAIALPEAVLITHSQLQRAKGLYQFVELHAHKKSNKLIINPLIKYLEALPKQYLEHHIVQRI